MVTKIHWKATDRASEALVDVMIEDIGIDDERARKAARQEALEKIEEDSGLDIGQLQLEISCFAEGYEQALEDLESQ